MRRLALIASVLVAFVAHAPPALADYTSTVRSTPGLVAHCTLTVSAVNAAGRSATVRRRFDAVRRARR